MTSALVSSIVTESSFLLEKRSVTLQAAFMKSRIGNSICPYHIIYFEPVSSDVCSLK